MKKLATVLVLSISITGFNFAQANNARSVVYTFFVNVVNENFPLPLIGFVNIAGGSQYLPQLGFLNYNQDSFSTLQGGFVNITGGDTAGMQLGFMNYTGNNFAGAQISIINIAQNLNGIQLGVFNYVETVENGIPIGFLSIARNGGYKALEAGISEISPFNVSFKIGIEKFYTLFIAGYNPFRDGGIENNVSMGMGFGSIIPMGETFFFNLEIAEQNTSLGISQIYGSVILQIGYNILPQLSLTAGPSLTWAYNENGAAYLYYHITEYAINDKSRLSLGARAALRFRW